MFTIYQVFPCHPFAQRYLEEGTGEVVDLLDETSKAGASDNTYKDFQMFPITCK